MTRAEVIHEFSRRLRAAADDPADASVIALPAGVMYQITREAAEYAKREAATDPRLGYGRDARAVFALTLGVVHGAGIMLNVISDLLDSEE